MFCQFIFTLGVGAAVTLLQVPPLYSLGSSYPQGTDVIPITWGDMCMYEQLLPFPQFVTVEIFV